MKYLLKLILLLVTTNIGAQITSEPTKFNNGLLPSHIYIGAKSPNILNSTIFQLKTENTNLGGGILLIRLWT